MEIPAIYQKHLLFKVCMQIVVYLESQPSKS